MQKMFRLETTGGIAVLTFDTPDNPVNVWGSAGVAELREVTARLAEMSPAQCRAVVLISGKPGCFHVGADLKDMSGQTTQQRSEGIMEFDAALRELAALPMPTIAAVSGPCLGGGFELALSCTARVALDSPKTVFGLPETGVGLFSAGGGTQRLPRLIGYPAIGMILDAKPVGAQQALSLGIVDKLWAADDDLQALAVAFAGELADGKATLQRTEFDFSDVDEVVARELDAFTKKRNGRLLPGPKYAMRSLAEGVKLPLDEGLKLEKKYFIEEVAGSPEAAGSIHTFLLKSMSAKAKNMIAPGYTPRPVKKMAVVGFGAMGRGIVISALSTLGVPVVVKDVPEAMEAGLAFVRKILEKQAAKGRVKRPIDELMASITTVSDYSDDFKDVDLVVEAVFEDVGVKKTVYADLCRVVRPDCVIDTNTSFLSVDELAEGVERPERFCGLHFFSPVWLMQLVEVVAGKDTSPATRDDMIGFVTDIRKRPLVCRDSPGFVVNTVMDPIILDMYRFLEQGVSIEQVDRAMKAFGMPLGPVKLADEIGLDVSGHIFAERGIHIKTLENMVEAGRYGFKKCGKGFFLENGSVDPEAEKLIAVGERKDYTDEQLQNTVLEDMVRIGKRLLDEGVVSDPSYIDIGMLWGTSYPADKGGPMKWSDLSGMSERLFGKKFYPEA